MAKKDKTTKFSTEGRHPHVERYAQAAQAAAQDPDGTFADHLDPLEAVVSEPV